jgi:translocation and assembly module TamB
MPRRPQKRVSHRRWDPGRILAQLLCAVFGLVGGLPLLGGMLVRSQPIQRWAASETARVLKEQLGVTASYRVEMKLWPLQVSVHDLVVPSNDGGAPALQAKRVAVTPRVFSLLAGKLDVGDIEIDQPKGRIVLRDGKIVNVSYRLPKRKGPAPKLKRAPFSSLSVTDAEVELDVAKMKINAGPMDVDVFADRGPSFEVRVRSDHSAVTRHRTMLVKAEKGYDKPDLQIDKKGRRWKPAPAVDEDVLCGLDLRAHFEPGSLLVRRFSLLGEADHDPAPGTRPACHPADNGDDTDQWRVAARLSEVRVVRRANKPPLVDGHVMVRGPTAIVNRFVHTGTLRGWAGLVGDIRYDGRTRLPEFHGKLRGGGISMAGYVLAHTLAVSLDIDNDEVRIPRFDMGFGDGQVTLFDGLVKPFAKGIPITAPRAVSENLKFESMMRDFKVTPNTIVQWHLKKSILQHIRGTFWPMHIDGDLVSHTRDFEVFDRSYRDPARRHMIGVPAATVHARVGLRPNAFEIYDAHVTFGHSLMISPIVSIGFHNEMLITVDKSSRLDLADVSPLINIKMSGKAKIDAKLAGQSGNPLLTGHLAVKGLVFGGFPIGNIDSAKIRFRPLKVDFLEAHGQTGQSPFYVSSARLNFDTRNGLVADANVSSSRLDIRDFMAMWLFEDDPRFKDIKGQGKLEARIHYVLHGPDDPCGGGNLTVAGNANFNRLDLFDERYDSGKVDFDFRWPDAKAGYLGLDMDVPSMTLTKGTGTMLGAFSIHRGGIVRGHMIGSGLPLSRIDSLGSLGLALDGHASAVAELGGTVDALSADAHVRISPVRIGSAHLPASELDVRLEPKPPKRQIIGHSKCGQPITAPFDRTAWNQDKADGVYHVDGDLFGGQVVFNDVTATRQRKKTMRGDVTFNKLDVGALAELSPAVALSDTKPKGRLSGKLHIDDMPLDDSAETRATVRLSSMWLSQSGFKVDLQPGARPIQIEGGRVQMPGLALAVDTPRGQRGVFDLHGGVSGLGKKPNVDATLALRPADLSGFVSLIPRAERASGTIQGKLRVTGPPSALRYQGGFSLDNGEVSVRGLPSPVSGIQLAVALDNDELRITRGQARIGDGTLRLSGSAPLRGFKLGAARGVITARRIHLPLESGIAATVDADLVANWRPPTDTAEGEEHRSLPHVTGQVTLRSFKYSRPITMTADISRLAQRGKRTKFDSYDPADDTVDYDITLLAPRPLKIENNLVDAELSIDKDGLVLAGTNQRVGMRGTLRLKPGGRIRLRRNEFEIRQGFVRFDDLTRIAPQVDVTAVTDYHRYSESATGAQGGAAATAAAAGSGTETSARGGQWHIKMHAYGDADKLRIDLTSEPQLAQDDIFLLLTVGLTRAELDQAQSASVGESVALEALGTLSGADKAVTEALPVIDEFRFGSAYSSRTGRTEPTVTIGKRLAHRIRANVTSGLSDSREVRSNVEWRLSPRVSVEGSYDNVNDISSSSLGNLGADIRWRLEFE